MPMLVCVAAAAALVLLFSAAPSAAQSLPDLGFERRVAPSLEPLQPGEPPSPPPAIDVPPGVPDIAPRPVPTTDPSVPRVFVARVAIVGNTQLDAAELAAIAAPFENADLSVADILTLRDALTRAYVDAGFVTSGAVIPEQDLRDGSLRVDIIEGALEAIVVRGVTRLDPDYVRARLARAIADPVDLADVQAGLQRLLNDRAIRRLDARLGPGSARGLAILEVDVEEARPIDARLLVANDRSPSIGGTRGSVLLVAPNTLGFGDETRLELTAIAGGPEAAISYSVPIAPNNLRAFVSASTYRFDLVEDPLDELDINAEATGFALGFAYPLIDADSARLSIVGTVDRQFTNTTLDDEGFSFAPGAVDGETVVTAVRFTPNGEWRSARRALVGRATVSVGVDALDATVQPDGIPDGQFVSLFAQGLWAERLNAEGRRIIAQANLQLSNDGLLPIEQIAIGGSDTVRGYRTNTLVRDSGWTASLEFREPVARLRLSEDSVDPATGTVEALVFTDHGGGWNVNRPTPSVTAIHSVGAGVRWQPLDGLDVGLDVGVPLRDARPGGADSLQDMGIHFRITLRPLALRE